MVDASSIPYKSLNKKEESCILIINLAHRKVLYTAYRNPQYYNREFTVQNTVMKGGISEI